MDDRAYTICDLAAFANQPVSAVRGWIRRGTLTVDACRHMGERTMFTPADMIRARLIGTSGLRFSAVSRMIKNIDPANDRNRLVLLHAGSTAVVFDVASVRGELAAFDAMKDGLATSGETHRVDAYEG